MRLYIYTKDIQIITGKSPHTARKIMKLAKIALNKREKAPLTIREFCEFEQIDFNEVSSLIK